VFLGHTINIVLGPMSVLVHGIRLNVLEFSSHAGLTWSGRQYKPLENMQK
jgi:V/A-type H+-transporting ATPase subunit I